MRKWLSILASSFRHTWEDFKQNKLRTALSLTGVAFGIFCIIGVLATVNSLERNIQDQVKSLGSNTIYIDKWDYTGHGDIPMWKFRSRPNMKYNEAGMIRERSEYAGAVTYLLQLSDNISYRDDILSGVSVYGVTEDQINIQPINFETGRYISPAEFNAGSAVGIIGYLNAESLFGVAERAIGRQVDLKGKKITIVGVIKKEGKNFIGWDYDNCIMVPYKLARGMFDENFSNPIIMVKGRDGVPVETLTTELRGIMRQIRKIAPLDEDNFALNSVQAISDAISQSFITINIVGAIIGGISLIVGMFGIANIMFVTVKERTPMIGLKKAIGARSQTILLEFLLEAAALCIFGGAIGLVMVYILTLILSGPMNFPIYISIPMLITTIIICLVVGVLAGIIPARKASRLDPVVAMRS